MNLRLNFGVFLSILEHSGIIFILNYDNLFANKRSDQPK